MKDFIPLFPLQLVVFPGEQVNLHIFEPRYRQLIREVETNRITFGIPAFIDETLMPIGTEIELLSVEKRHEDGTLDVKTQGTGLFETIDFYKVAPNKLYAGGDIKRLPDNSEGDVGLNEEIIEQIVLLFKIMDIDKSIPEPTVKHFTFKIAHHVGFSLEQEYEFLCIPTEFDRQKFMLAHVKRLIPIVQEMENLKIRVKMNGHFKNLKPPNI